MQNPARRSGIGTPRGIDESQAISSVLGAVAVAYNQMWCGFRAKESRNRDNSDWACGQLKSLRCRDSLNQTTLVDFCFKWVTL